MTTLHVRPPTTHKRLLDWVDQYRTVLEPDDVHWCDGSEAERDRLCAELESSGTFRRLNSELRPNTFLALSDPADVARVEDRTFIASVDPDDAGPTNNWRAPAELKGELLEHFAGVQVDQGHLAGRDEVARVRLHVEEVFFELGELAAAKEAVPFHQERR